MYQNISQRYQKALVTVAMGFRTEKDIQKNGLYRFIKSEKEDLIKYVSSLFNKSKNVLVLKIKQTGYRSEHININSEEELDHFIKNLNNIYEEDNEIWVVSSSVIKCWRCRIYLSNSGFYDTIEMAYSCDNQILDHINSDFEVPYICYRKEDNRFKISNTNLEENKMKEANLFMQDILSKYANKFKQIKKELYFIGIDGISLNVRINNGYDFHDFDVSYGNIDKVVNYYLPQLTKIKKL